MSAPWQGVAVVAAARALLGTRFRPQGRDAAFGLDCVGLVALALKAAGFAGEVPANYALRGGSAAGLAALLDGGGLVRVAEAVPGDVVLAVSGAGQFHLGVWTGAGLVHADAGLRRVVERPGAVPWPVVGWWRFGG